MADQAKERSPLARALTDAREAMRPPLTQRALAEQLGVAVVTVQRWELGLRVPRVPELQRIAAALRVPLARLFAAPARRRKKSG